MSAKLAGAHARGRFSSSTSTYGHLGTISRNSPVSLACIVSFRERNSKDRMLGSRYALNSSTMGVYDFLRNSQTKAGAAAICRTRGIQAVELLKNHLELGRGNGVSLILKAYAHAGGTVAESCSRSALTRMVEPS